jgi:hypothetical protein
MGKIEKILAKGGKGWYNTHIALHKGSVSLAYSR